MIDLKTATKEQLEALLIQCFSGNDSEIFEQARQVQMQNFGKRVYLRGLIEMTNYCANDCLYCGIRASNTKARRYRLTKTEILDCCRKGYEAGLRTFVIQGGEDRHFTDAYLCEIISEIKNEYPNIAVTLSLGEKTEESYECLKKAGVDRYLLRHETANAQHYAMLHPSNLSFANRKKCLYDLKGMGFQTGAGLMVNSPGQTTTHLAEDLLFLRELQPQMVGIGPFIPHKDTPFAQEPAGDFHQTLCMLALTRILLPHVLLPATTALGSIRADGYEQGLKAGANVIMTNISPKQFRADYSLYDGKIQDDLEMVEKIAKLKERLKAVDFELDMSRGDHV